MKSTIEWFAKNHVAANLCMALIIILGLSSLSSLRKEILPNISLERVNVQSELAGASSEVIESSICKPIENSIYDIQGTLDLTSYASKGLCSITIDVEENIDTSDIVDEIKSRLEDSAILPENATKPEIRELLVRNRVMKLIISGDANITSLTQIARRIRNDLMEAPEISFIDLVDVKPSEVQIQISSHNIEKYSINFDSLAKKIQQQSDFLPGGVLETSTGDILIAGETNTKKNIAFDYENILIAASDNGGELRLGDIANIVDTRYSTQAQATFNGFSAVSIDIYRVGNQSILEMANEIDGYLKTLNLPDNIAINVWQDDSQQFKDRISLLLSNALIGLFFLFITLLLFLDSRVSFWVSAGIPITFLGTLSILGYFDVSINIISLFAFILVLGIVVDDAVVVGESIHLQHQKGIFGTKASILGTHQVYNPIVFAIVTSIIAFFPLLNLPGPEGKLMKVIPMVVIFTLIFSLFESLYILPAHLASQKSKPKRTDSFVQNWQDKFSLFLDNIITNHYRPILIYSLKHKRQVVILFIAIFLLFVLIFQQGWIKSVLLSSIEANTVTARVEFPAGTSRNETQQAVNKLYTSAQSLNDEYLFKHGEDIITNIYTAIGPKEIVSSLETSKNRDHLAEVTISLSAKNRHKSANTIVKRWRQLTGEINNTIGLSYNASLNPSNPDIEFEFLGQDYQQLNQAAESLKSHLQQYDGIYELRSSQEKARMQASITLKDNASSLGLTLNDVLYQINKAFQGTNAQKIQTSDDTINVILSLPPQEVASPWHLEHLPIEYAPQKFVSLFGIANINYVPSFEKIKRYERKRVVSVSAYVDKSLNSSVRIRQDIRATILKEIREKYPDIKWDNGGAQRVTGLFLDQLAKQYLLAIIGMYAVMAILFRSYSQPLIVLFAIPFGIIGAIVGHLLLGKDLSIWSYAGMVAVSGVVVNDNLVLMDYINLKREQGHAIVNAVVLAGKARFRPIALTSLTTFVGLAPIILESSTQAQFLKPMAISLAFGVLFATLISLILVPATYLLLYQAKDKLNT